jgi:3-dehydroquinate synthetase/shikimate kinase
MAMSSPQVHESRPHVGGQHVFLVGFMGSGKTTVGRALAKRIHRSFVDLDQMIADHAGTSLREIFRSHGEVGFRARERAALRDTLDRGKPCVMATGASTFIDATMREWIGQAGKTVYLQASPEVLVARIDAGEPRRQRPLVSGPRVEETVRRMLADRASDYEGCDMTVRTDLARVEQVVEEIVRSLRLDRRPARRAPDPTRRRSGSSSSLASPTAAEPLTVTCGQATYPVRVRDEGAAWLAAEIRTAGAGPRAAVISDETVDSLYGEPLAAQLRSVGFEVSQHRVATGETAKILSTAAGLYDSLLAAGVGPRDTLVGFGGGVVNDLTGFVAGTLHGGMAHVRILTTTAAAIDASVGGRAALHTRHGPDLISTVHAPRRVLVPVSFLASQSRRRHASGLASAMRLAATMDATFFDALVLDASKLLDGEAEPLALALQRAIDLARRAGADGAPWRFGQILGAALTAGKSQILAGEAAALGMAAECEWAGRESGGDLRAVRMLAGGLTALELPVDWRSAALDAEAVSVGHGGSIRLVHVTQLGNHEIRVVPTAALAEFVRRTP